METPSEALRLGNDRYDLEHNWLNLPEELGRVHLVRPPKLWPQNFGWLRSHVL